jgi:transcriptional regulator with XRE-family HTH domain
MRGTVSVEVTSIGRALAILRLSRGWNQHELARRAGIHNSSVSEYERGRTIPEYATIARLVEALGYPASALDRARRFLAALDGQEWGPAPEGAPDGAVALARQAGRAAEHLALTFLELQAGGWKSRAGREE